MRHGRGADSDTPEASTTPAVLVAASVVTVITYTVFDPDDGSGRTYWWYGEAMVYVHEHGVEIDAFEVGEGGAPTAAAVRAAVDERHGEG